MDKKSVACVHFKDLHTHELYEIMTLRQEVFIVEQNCPYLDCDGKDLESFHLYVRDEKRKIVAYTRLLPEGVSYIGYTSIGRVVNHPSVRGTGIGKFLMENSIEHLKKLFGTHYPIKIGAQSYLLHFYESFGFVSTGEEYMEDGIPHTKMVLKF